MSNILSFFPEITNMPLFIIAQICVLIALVFAIYSYYCKQRTKFFIFQLSCQILYAISYALLFSWIGFIVVLIAATKSTLFLFYAKNGFKPELAELVIFESLVLIIGAVTFNSIYCLMLIVGNMLIVYATWQNNIIVLIIGQITASILISIYNLTVANYMGAVFEITIALFVLFSLLKTIKENKKNGITDLKQINLTL